MRKTTKTMLGAMLWAAGFCAAPAAPASEAIAPPAALRDFLAQHAGSAWSGPAELWIDPLGNDTETSDATLHVDGDRLRYTWAFRGDPQQGVFTIDEAGLRWRDSWHQGDEVAVHDIAGDPALLAVAYAYPAGPGGDWHWRMRLSRRPDGELVLQMTNVAPWGEEARAVRMVFEPDGD